jgi:hypothetical protein
MLGTLPGSDKPSVTVGRLEDLKKNSNSITSFSKKKSSNAEVDTKGKVKSEEEEEKEEEEEVNDAVQIDGGVAETKSSHDDCKADDVKKSRRARKKWKKPKDKPNRPLSAYNLFFQKERAKLLGDDANLKSEGEKGKKRVHRKTHGKIGFAEMARTIGAKWKSLPQEEKSEFQEVAAKEKDRYAKELAEWTEEQKKKAAEERRAVKAAEKQLASMEKKTPKECASHDKMMSPEEQLQLRLQMLQRGGPQHQPRRQLSTINYLRAMQGDRPSALGGVPFGAGLSQHSQRRFPNASEASANALLNQFQGGMDVSGGPSDLERLQHLRLARMQMMNSMNSMLGANMGVSSSLNPSLLGSGMGVSSMMGGSMRGSMSDSIRMGNSLSHMNDLEFQRYQQMMMMQGMNQMGGTNIEMIDRSQRSEEDYQNIEYMMRLQNRFNGGM